MTEPKPVPALYGHPFSSYTWKPLIALHATGTPFDFRVIDGDHPRHAGFVADHAGPWGKFPVLLDGEHVIFESTTIVEYLAQHYPGGESLLPANPDAAIGMRMLDRTFDNYVMAPMSAIVEEHIRNPEALDAARCAQARARLEQSYTWLEGWLEFYPSTGGQISLIECTAAPALFYADWVHPIAPPVPPRAPGRQWLNRLPPVATCIDAARPYRPFFPPGAPDRD